MARNEETDPARQIPPAAAAIVALLNTRPHGADHLFPETLHTTEEASAALRPLGLPDTVAPTPERIAEVRSLRTILMGLLSAPDSAEAAARRAELTERASSVTLSQDFSVPGKVQLRQVSGDPIVGGITRAVADLMADGTWSRLRVCDNEGCQRVFYDTTRSRTQRWHSYATCGNRTNVASYRARKKARPDGRP
ncbi:CGNR zinc finger domain-containing protein [Streptomyces sp. NPDC008222]|uniref:CGNR zinc finger domain-containing protein n=1 Tax=Streptomyces sp. NPDC008222 TaxID=3364820 RepID=UPI0036EA3497